MNTFPTKYIRLAGILAEPADPQILPVEVGGDFDRRTGEYRRWAKYTVRFDYQADLYEAEGAVEIHGNDTDALYLAAGNLPALYSALADLQVAF